MGTEFEFKEEKQKPPVMRAIISGMIAGAVIGSIGGFAVGGITAERDMNAVKTFAQQDIRQADNHWRKSLIDHGFAEYDRKTGEWKLRDMDDVVEEQLINKAPPSLEGAPLFHEEPLPEPAAEEPKTRKKKK